MVAAILPMGTPNRKSVPRPAERSVGSGIGAAPKAPKKNTRDYGKAAPVSAPVSAPPVDPFGVTAGSSRLGGL